MNSTKNHYILAEKLWTDGNYAASVAEFEKVTAKDPHGKLGLQALFRGAMTETLYLNHHSQAVKKLKSYAELTGDTPLAWDALKQIGEIYFSKTEQYDKAIQHYRSLLKAKPDSPEAPEFLYRIGKSHFYLWQFDDSVVAYREILTRFSNSPWSERAALELGTTFFTRQEEQRSGGRTHAVGGFEEAIQAYQSFIKTYPKSSLVSEARFGIASCLEEEDKLDAAYQEYEKLKPTYPSPNVIEIKLARIRERKAQRSH